MIRTDIAFYRILQFKTRLNFAAEESETGFLDQDQIMHATFLDINETPQAAYYIYVEYE